MQHDNIPEVTERFTPPPRRDQRIALLVATVCALAFLGPAVLPTRALVPYPPELLDRLGAAAPATGTLDPEVFRGNITMGDKYNQSLTWDRITQDRFAAGELPTWTRDIGGGVPFVPQMGQVYHPFNLLLLVVPSAGVYGIWYLLHLVLFGLFGYRFLRRIAVRHTPALFGMVALILGLWTQARVHHNVMLSAVLPVFAALSCTHHLLRCRGGLGHVAGLAACIGVSWLSGFAPASLMCTYLVCGYALVLAWTGRQAPWRGPLLRFAAAVGLGLALAAAQIVPVLQAAAVSSRNPATIADLAQRCLDGHHLATALWPSLFAWPADHFYPGMQVRHAWPALAYLERELYPVGFSYPETAFYIGLAPLVLAFGALRDRGTWFFGAAALFGLTMALGLWLPVTRFLPGAHSGDVKRFLLLFGVCAPVAAALGLDRVTRAGRGGLPLLLAATASLVSLLLFALHLASPASLQAFYGSRAEQLLGLDPGTMAVWVKDFPSEAAVNRDHLLQLFGTTALVGLAVVAALWRPGPRAAALLVAVTATELLWHGAGPVVAVPTERVTRRPAILAPVLASHRPNGVRPRLQRLLPPDDADNFHYAVWPNLAGFHGAEDLAAYSPLPKRRMEEFFLCIEPDAPGKRSVALGGAGVGALRKLESLRHPLVDLIGIEWLITRQPIDLPGHRDATPADTPAPYRLYRRSTCLPRATFVTRARILPDRTERLAALTRPTHRPAVEVVLEDPQAPRPADGDGAAPALVEIRSHADEQVEIRVRNPAAGYLRLADPYDAGWTATVDGESSTVYVADHYLRAVFLPAGDHAVVFRYNGTRVRTPRYLSLAALLSLLILAALGRPRRAPAERPS